MTEKITGIVLNVRKYNDKNSIVTLFTRSRGRLSFISPVGSGKASKARRARLMPLSVIATDLNFRSGVELQRLGSVSLDEVWKDIYFNNEKRALTIFMADFLNRLLMASMPEENLFDFIVNSIRNLDNMESGISDFHIPFLVSMLAYAGIKPDVSGYEQGKVFDFNSGSFLYPEEAGVMTLPEDDSKHVMFVTRLNFSNIKRLRLTNAGRRQILYGLLNYYSFHFPGISSIKAPEVLREIFS